LAPYSRRRAGFTLTESLVAVAVIGIGIALSGTLFSGVQQNQELKFVSRGVGNWLLQARTLAIQSGNNHIVYLATTANVDACGNPLEDAAGVPVPLLVIDDGPPGTGNCCIDPGETIYTEPATDGISWGATVAGVKNPKDSGSGVFTTGTTFADASGAQTRWVMFRPDGIPVGFTTACAAGEVGSGSGGIYLTNAERDYAAVMSPLGSVQVRGFSAAAGSWVD
jgi:prepilin-type N-terminal cleavage/methylation domain-containing protein